jgi:hypothetical protein
MPLYDPARGPFRAFALHWAHIMLLRYYSTRRVRDRVEVLFSELRMRYPDLEMTAEVGEIAARLTRHNRPSVEEEAMSAEEATERAAVYEELIRITFDGPSPPHQLLAFGFCKLLEWKPSEVVAHCSDTPLRALAEQFITAYVQKTLLAEPRIRSLFAGFRQRMECPVGEVLDEKTPQSHSALRGGVVSDTVLREYYTSTKDPAADVSHWWEAVRRRVVSAIQRQRTGPLAALIQILLSPAGRRQRGARRDAR